MNSTPWVRTNSLRRLPVAQRDPSECFEDAIFNFVERIAKDEPHAAERAAREAFALAVMFPELAESVGIGPEDALA